MKRFTYTIVPSCLILAACGGTPRPLPDISHATVWHVNDDAARSISAHVPQSHTHAVVPVFHHQTVAPQSHYSAYSPPVYQQPHHQASPNHHTSQTSQKSLASIFNRNSNVDFLPMIMQAENQSSGHVKNILAKSREMTLYRKEIIQGGCWDYLDAAWTRAGVGRNMRQTVYKSTHGGAYAHVDDLRVGDWIYHVNHSYKNIEHSGMFIGWVDKSRNLGLTLSYAGEGRKEPARYKVYDLSSVYNIMRAPS